MNLSDLPPLIGGRYRPIRCLGEGAMGSVFEVEHQLTGERLALKLLRAPASSRSEVVERFKREARASIRIKSQHVVKVVDADVASELDDALFLVMELLEGADLEQTLNQSIPRPAEVVEWLRQAASGLDRAHRIGIVHRDLKPENLYLTWTEQGEPLVKILDFGIAKTMEDAPGTTQSGQVIGTPAFMSPEQARASDDIGPAADRYALGLIAYRLLTGVDYWLPADNVAGLIAQIVYEPMPAPSERDAEFGPEFDQWFAKACSRDPSKRFATATEQIQALAKAFGVGWRHSADFGAETTGANLVGAIERTSADSSEASVAPTLTSATKDLREPSASQGRRRWLLIAALSLAIAAGLFLAFPAVKSGDGAAAPDTISSPIVPVLPVREETMVLERQALPPEMTARSQAMEPEVAVSPTIPTEPGAEGLPANAPTDAPVAPGATVRAPAKAPVISPKLAVPRRAKHPRVARTRAAPAAPPPAASPVRTISSTIDPLADQK